MNNSQGIVVEKLSHHFIIDPLSFDNALAFYRLVFGAVESERAHDAQDPQGPPLYVKLELPDFTIIVSRGVTEIPRKVMVEVQTMDADYALRVALAFGASRVETISPLEASRGIKTKVTDPFGFTFGFTEEKRRAMSSCAMGYSEENKAILVSANNLPFRESESRVNLLEQQLFDLKMVSFLHKKNHFKAFYRSLLPEIINELQAMNAMLLGFQVAIYTTPELPGRFVMDQYHKRLMTHYWNLLSNVPAVSTHPSNWPDLKDLRSKAADATRQFLKNMQLARVRNDQVHHTLPQEVKEEEARLSWVMSCEQQLWREQNLT